MLFKDDFSAYGTGTGDLNLHLPAANGAPLPTTQIRQSGSLGAWRFIEQNADLNSQIGNNATNAGQQGAPSYADYLLLAYTGAATLQLPVNEQMAQGKPLTISMDLGTALPPGASDQSWWLSVRLGSSGSYYPVVGGDADFAFLYRINKAIQVFTTGAAGVDFPALNNRHFTMVLTDLSGSGSAFAGNGSRVALYNGENLVGTFQTEQLTEEFLNFSVQNAFASIDNLAIERGLPSFISKRLRVLATDYSPATGGMTLTWASEAGKDYRIVSSQSLGSGWTGGDTVYHSTGVQTTATVPNPGGPRRFFRVQDASDIIPLAFTGQPIVHDPVAKTVVMSDAYGDAMIRLNYAAGCRLDRVQVNGRETIATDTGAYTGLRVNGNWVTSRTAAAPLVSVQGGQVTVSGIQLSSGPVNAVDTWTFTPQADAILWDISRNYSSGGTVDDICFPGWDFANMYIWTAGLLDTGGVAWPRYISTNYSYGAHSSSVDFWKGDDGLSILTEPQGALDSAARFTHGSDQKLTLAQSLSATPLLPKQNLRRSVSGADLWAPFTQSPGTIATRVTIQAQTSDEFRDRGQLNGVDGQAVADLLDTIGRYGVIDKKLMGGNGWLTGFFCLHEPFFAIMGLAAGSPDYTANFSATLDSWRDLALKPDGRVLPRWHHDTSDNIVAGTYTAAGYYEVGWGYLLDSQPDYVANVSEQFDLTGDLAWLQGHKEPCERALDWLLARDADNDGLVEMLNSSRLNGKSSDWIDIVWASGENAFVNAQLYNALILWSEREAILGDTVRAASYASKAAKLKAAFILPISQGGFWNPAYNWFAYWRDGDGSIHGDNLTTPVNFAAVAYGIATPAQRDLVLAEIETRTTNENLFHWPICVLPFASDEGGGGAFPTYENGDIFLSWGELGVRSYAATQPALALKYVNKLLDRYKTDALSYQRYARNSQAGLGDDILAGNSMTIAGLYRDLYGVRPCWNRMMLDPHLTPALEGTVLHYLLRGVSYQLTLGSVGSTIAGDGFSATAAGPFASATTPQSVTWFSGTGDKNFLAIERAAGAQVSVNVAEWSTTTGGVRRWTETHSAAAGSLYRRVSGLSPGLGYTLRINGADAGTSVADAAGIATFTVPAAAAQREMRVAPTGT